MVCSEDLVIDVLVYVVYGWLWLCIYCLSEVVVLLVLVYLYGGGWVFFSIDLYDWLMCEIVVWVGCVVIGVDYVWVFEVCFLVVLE